MQKWFFLATVLVLGVSTGCTVGPRYAKPTAPVPPAYKEEPPGWKTAQPSDQIAKGKWWQIYQDSQLNDLEEQINISNQTLKAALAQFEQERALVRQVRADYYPTITAGASGSRNRLSANRALATKTTPYTDLQIPVVGVSYEPDLFGSVRKTVEEARANAQASAGDLENVSLSVHADLAVDYFQVRTLDAEEQLLRDTVDAYQRALELTQSRYTGGVASGVDVAQAQTVLETTRAQMIDIQVARAQFEHAIAVLIGEPASTFNFAFSPWHTPPPVTPAGVPSDLMERRPDVAASERRVAAANAQIGVARAGYFPIFNLSGSGGFESNTITNLISGPSGFLSLGASAVVTAFDVGRRRAISDEAKAAYDQSVANYRQTLLVAFREVEDNLAALRILEDEAKTQEAAVAASQHSLDLSTTRYKGGVTTYLEVTTAQEIALSDQTAAVELLARRMTASVQLIQALGGGWDASSLTRIQMTSAQPEASQSQPARTQVAARP
jgi:NodT family efflux transporter outer membrane factor (OMF) lipoprotein